MVIEVEARLRILLHAYTHVVVHHRRSSEPYARFMLLSTYYTCFLQDSNVDCQKLQSTYDTCFCSRLCACLQCWALPVVVIQVICMAVPWDGAQVRCNLTVVLHSKHNKGGAQGSSGRAFKTGKGTSTQARATDTVVLMLRYACCISTTHISTKHDMSCKLAPHTVSLKSSDIVCAYLHVSK